jgi:hypothetical protein
LPIAGPFYAAWVDPSETTFNSSHYRMDEYIFSAKRTLAEGEKPLLEIEIQNPHVGILSPGRKYWLWFSWFNGTSIVPLFFGRVVGSPVQIFEEVITVQLVAWPIDYKQRVQLVAETLKVPPFYDQVFIDVGKRDDPDTILEAHAKVWDVNPVTHVVTANDIITGSDGNVDFTGDDHFYDSMQMTIGQPPATAILMDASVSWTQTARGTVYIGNYNFGSLSGAIISDWPKPLAQIGSGWSVYSSDAYDTGGVESATTFTNSGSYTNTEKTHEIGDCLSANWSVTSPAGPVAGSMMISFSNTTGLVDPFAVDEDGEPSPINIPASQTANYAYVLGYHITATLTLQYAAERKRTERAIFLVRADTQPVLVDPLLSQDSETVSKSGVDVGVPIINLLNWTSIAGTAMQVGQIIFPDNPNVPGGQSVQICVVAGTAGTVEPAFSDVPGFETVDGTITWSSLGQATPPDNAVDWTALSHVNAGTIILPKRAFYIQYNDLTAPMRHSYAVHSVAVSEGQIIQMPDGSFQVCTISGTITDAYTSLSPGSAVFATLSKLPSGNTYQIATTAGVTGPLYMVPPFNENLHGTTTDGTVVWTCIGSGDIPAGGIPGDVHAATYFATDRGVQSLEYLGALVRARLLYRARCVEISFDCEYARGVSLTTCNTVTLHDPRIAGGVALGKVKGTELSVSDTGVAGCRVTLACTAGLGNAVSEAPGDPDYVDDGYVDGWQQYDNVTVVLPTTTDLGYAPPVYSASDDGLTFPLTRDMVVLVDQFHVNETGVAGAALGSIKAAATLQQQPPISAGSAIAQQNQLAMINANSLDNLLKNNPNWQEFQFKPVNAGPFNKVYNVEFTDLQVPMGIDLTSSTVT